MDQQLQGECIDSVLMNFAEKRAHTNGSTRLFLDVIAKNEDVCHFYKQRGMNVESRWPKRLHIPGLTFYRVAKGKIASPIGILARPCRYASAFVWSSGTPYE